jgi:hypothetical protein
VRCPKAWSPRPSGSGAFEALGAWPWWHAFGRWLLGASILVCLTARDANARIVPQHPRAAQAQLSVTPAVASFSLGPAGVALGPPEEEEEDDDDDDDDARVVTTPDVEPTLLRKRSVPPFWIHRQYDTHTTRALAFPPVFVHRTPEPDHPEKLLHADLSLTFGWYSRRVERRRWINPAGLYFGSFSERKSVWGAVPLLMGYRRVGEQFNFGQFPFVWWWGTKFVKNLLVVPFHYQQRSPDGFRGMSALLFWYGHRHLDDTDPTNDRRHFVAAPLYWRFQRGLRRFDFAFLYMAGENKLTGNEFKAAAPFFVWQRSEFGNRKELWTLGWVRRIDTARRRSTWAVPFALTFRHRDPEREVFSATPFFWRTRNHLAGTRLTLAGPVGVWEDPRQRNFFAAPFWFQFHDKTAEATTRVLFPLAVSRQTRERTSAWTLLGGGARSKNGWSAGVPPLLTFAGKRDDGRRYQTALGLFWHLRNPAEQTDRWVLAPLAWYDRRENHRHVGVPGLFTSIGWGGGRHHQVVTPLFWHFRDHEYEKRTVVAGPVFHHQTRAGYDGGLVPLAFWGDNERRRYGIVPWIGFADVTDRSNDSRLTMSPVFVRYADPDTRTLGVLGLAWDVRREDERHTAVVPFYYRRQIGERALTLTPIGGRLRDAEKITTLYGPYYRRKNAEADGWGVLPLLFHDARRVEGGIARHTVGVPLYLRRRAPQDDLDMWTPLVWRSNVRGDRPRRGLAVVPFYFRQRQPEGVDVDAGLGWFYSRDRQRRTHTIIAGPAFHRLSRTQVQTGVAPLYWWMDSEKKRRLLSFPAIFHFETKGKEHTTVAVPFWYDRLRPNGMRGWSAFPVVFGFRRLYNFTRFSMVPPGYVDRFRIQRNSRFTGFVPFVFRLQKCGFLEDDDPSCRYTLWGSAPLFLYGADGQGRRTHGALLLYYWDRRPDGWRLFTPLAGINNQPGKVLGWYAGPLAIKTTNTHRRSMFFPLWYRRAHRLKNEHLTLVAPPVYVAREKGDRRFMQAGLLFWQFRQPHKVSTAVIPPLFYHSHAYAQRRLTWVAPLFLRDNNMGKDETWTTFPPLLYLQRRHGENLDIVHFPLVWHIERGENQGTFGAFVWWDIRARDRIFQWAPGAYLRFKGRDDRDTRIIGPGLGWWTRDPAEDALHWRALFGLFGGGHAEGRRYFSIFGARIDRGPMPAGAEPQARMGRTSRVLRRAERRAQRAEAKAQRLLERQARVEHPRPGLERRVQRALARHEAARTELAALRASLARSVSP